MLEAQNLTLARGGKTLLSGISLTLHPGEVLSIIGPNGAGKSTLMKLLSGDLSADSGSIILEKRPLNLWSSRELARKRGVLPQNSELNFPLKVLEVVLLGRSNAYRDHETREDLEIARQCLDRVDLSGFETRIYTTLSGGEKQRVHLARVLAQLWKKKADIDSPRYYFLDEPTASLDIGHQQGLLQTARSLARKENAAVLAVLHDLNLAATFSDRILLLRQGKCLICGTPREVLTAEWIRDVFCMEVLVQEHPKQSGPLIIPFTTCDAARHLCPDSKVTLLNP